MNPTVLPDGRVTFKPFTMPEISPSLCAYFAKLRIYRGIKKDPQLYYLQDSLHLVTEQDEEGSDRTYYTISNLQLISVGKVSAETIWNLFTSSEAVSSTILMAYRTGIQLKQIPATMDLKRWFKRLVDYFEVSSYGVLNSSPVSVSFRNDEYTLAYFDQNKIVPGEFPTWNSFMNQMDEQLRPVFASFIWAALDNTNTGRQIMYIYDKKATGKTGKSGVISALTDGVLQQITAAITEKAIKDQFGYAQIYGKRLCVIGDCKNSSIIKNEVIHNLSGGDIAPVINKGEMAFFSKVYARIIIMSNQPPSIDTYRSHESSRLIAIELDGRNSLEKNHIKDGVFVGDNGYINRLIDQLPFFLHFCRECYATICPTHQELIVPDIGLSVGTEEEEQFEGIVSEFMEIGTDYVLTAADLRGVLQVTFQNVSSYNLDLLLGRFRTYIETLGVTKKRALFDGRRQFIYHGIRKKGTNNQLISSSVTLIQPGSSNKGTSIQSTFDCSGIDISDIMNQGSKDTEDGYEIDIN